MFEAGPECVCHCQQIQPHGGNVRDAFRTLGRVLEWGSLPCLSDPAVLRDGCLPQPGGHLAMSGDTWVVTGRDGWALRASRTAPQSKELPGPTC